MKNLYTKCIICFQFSLTKTQYVTECFVKTRSSHREVFCEKGILRPEKKASDLQLY